MNVAKDFGAQHIIMIYHYNDYGKQYGSREFLILDVNGLATTAHYNTHTNTHKYITVIQIGCPL